VQEEVKEETPVETVEEVKQEVVEESISDEEAEEILYLIGEEATAIAADVEAEQKKWHHERMMAQAELHRKAIPSSGSMVFEDKAENILLAIAQLLGNTKVHLNIQWDVVED
jgi:hypothetical protein